MKDELKRISHYYTRLDASYLEAWLAKHLGETISREYMIEEMLGSLVASCNYNWAIGLL